MFCIREERLEIPVVGNLFVETKDSICQYYNKGSPELSDFGVNLGMPFVHFEFLQSGGRKPQIFKVSSKLVFGHRKDFIMLSLQFLD